MIDVLSGIFNSSLVSATIRTTAPILLVALGGAFTAKSGIFNIALEGLMLLSAFTAVIGSIYLQSAWLGLVLGIVVSIAISLVFAFFVVRLKANEIVVGLAINTFAGGVTIALMKSIFGARGSIIDPTLKTLPVISIPGLAENGFFGELLSGYTPFVYLTPVFAVLVHFFFKRTRLGLYIRVAGENADSGAAVGIDMSRIKYISALFCGLFAGIAGAHLSIGYISLFTENMSSGRGFMALAALIFSNGDPLPLSLGCLLFGLADAVAIRLQGFGVPSYLILCIPYITVLLFHFIIGYRRRERFQRETPDSIRAYSTRTTAKTTTEESIP